MKIILVGFMGVGKTTVGKLLAQKINTDFIDLDQQFEKELGYSPSEYMKKYLEVGFREAEKQILIRQLNIKVGVISTGGGVLTLQANRDLLKQSNSKIIYLKSDFDVNLGRINNDENQRPLVLQKSTKELHELWQNRQKHYQEVTHVTINTNQKTPNQIVDEIIGYL